MVSNALWEVFIATGHIGAYLLYKDYKELDREALEPIQRCQKRAVTGQGEL